MNRTIRLLMFSDLLIMTSFGLVDPILAIFFKDNIAGGSILAAGLAGSLFLLIKSVVQLPFSKFIDTQLYPARLRWLILGSLLVSVVPFVYLFATSMTIVFSAQILHGIGSGLAYPAWLGLWSTHLDKGRESYEWSLYSTTIGLGTAVAAAVGAALTQMIGFNLTFALVGLISLFGSLMLFTLKQQNF